MCNVGGHIGGLQSATVLVCKGAAWLLRHATGMSECLCPFKTVLLCRELHFMGLAGTVTDAAHKPANTHLPAWAAGDQDEPCRQCWGQVQRLQGHNQVLSDKTIGQTVQGQPYHFAAALP